MATLSKGTLFPETLVPEFLNKVKGKSSIAELCGSEPIPFNGQKEFTFNFDSDIDIVAENGAKSHGGATIDSVTIVPIKFEYGMRVSDEFIFASDEAKLPYMKAFADGFAKKVAKGLDIAAFHGLNPRTKTASAVVGTNHFDAKVTQKVTYAAAQIDSNIEAAISLIEGSEGAVTGMAVSPVARQALAALKNSANERLYPELAWGGAPATLNGLKTSFNTTVNTAASGTAKDAVIVGDFENAFKWGFAKEMPIEVIQYGDPDNSGKDLKGYNQVYIRGEVYLGWAILDPASFARVEQTV